MLSKTMKSWFYLGLFVFASCDMDPNVTKLQYMPDMADAPTVKTQENYIDPPDFSVAQTATLYPSTIEESEKVFISPFSRFPKNRLGSYVKEGEDLFKTFCAVCHGEKADGNGRLTDVFPRPPNITKAPYIDRKDGFFFHRITFGSAIMPSHGHAVSPDERWKIILYIRSLQEAGK